MSRSIASPSLPFTTRLAPRLGIISPLREQVLLVYASFTTNTALPYCHAFHPAAVLIGHPLNEFKAEPGEAISVGNHNLELIAAMESFQ